jgi:hypothetical protein
MIDCRQDARRLSNSDLKKSGEIPKIPDPRLPPGPNIRFEAVRWILRSRFRQPWHGTKKTLAPERTVRPDAGPPDGDRDGYRNSIHRTGVSGRLPWNFARRSRDATGRELRNEQAIASQVTAVMLPQACTWTANETR